MAYKSHKAVLHEVDIFFSGNAGGFGATLKSWHSMVGGRSTRKEGEHDRKVHAHPKMVFRRLQ